MVVKNDFFTLAFAQFSVVFVEFIFVEFLAKIRKIPCSIEKEYIYTLQRCQKSLSFIQIENIARSVRQNVRLNSQKKSPIINFRLSSFLVLQPNINVDYVSSRNIYIKCVIKTCPILNAQVLALIHPNRSLSLLKPFTQQVESPETFRETKITKYTCRKKKIKYVSYINRCFYIFCSKKLKTWTIFKNYLQ